MKAWDFIWLPYLNPTILGVIGLMFLNQVPIIHQSIYRPTYLSMHLTTNICIYMYVYIYTYIYRCT